MKFNRHTRRMFLQGAGQTLLAIPFLPSILAEKAFAQAVIPKRYIIFQLTLDLGNVANWMPNSSGALTGRNMIPNRQISGGGYYQPLNEFVTSSSQSLARLYGTSLNGVLGYTNIIRGLDFPVPWGHSRTFGIGGVPSTSNNGFTNSMRRHHTFDYFMMVNKMVNPNGKILNCGSGDNNTGLASITYDTTGALVSPVGDVGTMYNRIFNSGTFPESAGGGSSTVTTPGTTSSTTIVTPAHRRHAVMNSVLEDYKRTINSRNISSEDRTKLTQAMDLFSDIQNRLPAGSTQTVTTTTPSTTTTTSSGACSYKSLAKTGSIGSAIHDAATSRVIIDIITAAFMCDATRVMSFNFDSRVDHNGVSHSPTVNNNWMTTGEGQSAMFKNLVGPLATKLASVTDSSNGKSLLHNSLLHATCEHGQVHSHMNHPAILIGNAGGGLSSGNYIDYSNRSLAPLESGDIGSSAADFKEYIGLSYNRLFVNIAQAFGLAPSAYEDNTLEARLNAGNVGGWGYALNANNPASWAPNNISKYDLNQFKNKLPMP